MAFFVDENGDPIAPVSISDEMRETVERHRQFVTQVIDAAEPGPNGVDFESAYRDATRIRENREQMRVALRILLRIWEPEFGDWRAQ